jgi:hypothetical protein
LGQDTLNRAFGSRSMRTTLAALSLFAATPAHASLFSGDALDAVANALSWVVLAIVPVIGIALFWIVHVMPEKIAHKRHHPQVDAIHTLCLLSLVFGGLLWPIAWLWAYTRPVAYRGAYGTDKHESYHLDMAGRARAGSLSAAELAHLRDELDSMEKRGALPPSLTGLRAQLDAMPIAAPQVAEGSV